MPPSRTRSKQPVEPVPAADRFACQAAPATMPRCSPPSCRPRCCSCRQSAGSAITGPKIPRMPISSRARKCSSKPAPGCSRKHPAEISALSFVQQPRQIECTVLATRASSRSTAGLPVPSGAPFCGRPAPPEEIAVPSELVPGAFELVPNAPPVTDKWCDPKPPIPPTRAKAIDDQAAQSATARMRIVFIVRTLLLRSNDPAKAEVPSRKNSVFSFRYEAPLGYLRRNLRGAIDAFSSGYGNHRCTGGACLRPGQPRASVWRGGQGQDEDQDGQRRRQAAAVMLGPGRGLGVDPRSHCRNMPKAPPHEFALTPC